MNNSLAEIIQILYKRMNKKIYSTSKSKLNYRFSFRKFCNGVVLFSKLLLNRTF